VGDHPHPYVIEAKDAEDASRIMESPDSQIDLVLTDVIMPGKSGPELVRRLREAHPKLRSIFMSGYTGDLVSSHGVEVEESFFLEKPFSKLLLLKKVTRPFTTRELEATHL
jgi:two-component system, cell cycle sensor histidine kinase and response regulator CckA